MLNGRVVVVTGASRGIGRAVARRMAAEGATVIGLGRDEAALAETAGGHDRITVGLCDVTEEDQVVEVLAAIEPVDVLVNNAGIAESDPLARTSLESWERQIAVNATGAFLCTRAVISGMRQRDWGRIVTVASVVGHIGASYITAYSASKHAVLGLTRSVAAEVAGTGVTANSVCPGYVRSDMTDRTIANISKHTTMTLDEAERHLCASTPLGRLIEPAEVAHAVAFLATEEAGAINGQSIIIDGGAVQQ